MDKGVASIYHASPIEKFISADIKLRDTAWGTQNERQEREIERERERERERQKDRRIMSAIRVTSTSAIATMQQGANCAIVLIFTAARPITDRLHTCVSSQ